MPLLHKVERAKLQFYFQMQKNQENFFFVRAGKKCQKQNNDFCLQNLTFCQQTTNNYTHSTLISMLKNQNKIKKYNFFCFLFGKQFGT